MDPTPDARTELARDRELAQGLLSIVRWIQGDPIRVIAAVAIAGVVGAALVSRPERED